MYNTIINPHNITSKLGWSLLHSIWQGLAIYLVLRVLLLVIPKSWSSWRYNLSLISLFSICGWFIYTLYNKLISISTSADPITAVNISEANMNNVQQIGSIEQSNFIVQSLRLLEQNMSLIDTAYMIGVILFIAKYVYNLLQLKSIKKEGNRNAPEPLIALLDKLKERLKLKNNIGIYISTKVDVPSVLGNLKPIILIPIACLNNMTTDQMEAIILHELAHIKRHDYLINLIQIAIETILFYNPFVWLISTIVRREREHCCDDIVLKQNIAPINYANALVSLETIKVKEFELALAATGNKNQLLNRIKRMMEMKKSRINFTQLVGILVILFAFASTLLIYTPNTFAQSKDDKKDTKKTTKTETYSWIYSEELTIIDSNGNERKYTRLEDVPQKDRERFVHEGTTMYWGSKGKKFVKTSTGIEVVAALDEAKAKVGPFKGETLEEGIQAMDEAIEKEFTGMKAEDVELIKETLNKSLKEAVKANADSKKILIELKKESNATDDEYNTELTKAAIMETLKEVDENINDAQLRIVMAKAQIEMDKALIEAEVNKKKLEDIDEKTKEVEVKIQEIELRKQEKITAINTQLTKSLQELDNENNSSGNAKTFTVNTKKVSVDAEKMINMMHEDGLIDKDGKYVIKKKKDKLYINGTLQPPSVLNKYNKYMNGMDITVEGESKKNK